MLPFSSLLIAGQLAVDGTYAGPIDAVAILAQDHMPQATEDHSRAAAHRLRRVTSGEGAWYSFTIGLFERAIERFRQQAASPFNAAIREHIIAVHDWHQVATAQLICPLLSALQRRHQQQRPLRAA